MPDEEFKAKIDTFITKIEESLKPATGSIGLKDFPAAFDGDGWVWIWRQIDEKKLDEPVFEAVIRIRPDALELSTEAFEMEISGGAWIPSRRRYSASRVYYAQYFDKFPSTNDFTALVRENLGRAWEGAKLMAKGLHEIEQRRKEINEVVHSYRRQFKS